MAKIVVIGPNLPDQTKGTFHVHALGCSDINHYSRQFQDDKENVLDMDSVEEIAEYVYDFEEDPHEYVNDFYLFPCVNFQKEETVKFTTVSFELYSEDMFLTVEIETSDLDETLSLLESVPNVRNIAY